MQEPDGCQDVQRPNDQCPLAPFAHLPHRRVELALRWGVGFALDNPCCLGYLAVSQSRAEEMPEPLSPHRLRWTVGQSIGARYGN